ncbi:MAG: DUF4411 family protein [Bacteroidetes bacterium]|nr:DUF4411 family protein [Bacteroidota bacterium]
MEINFYENETIYVVDTSALIMLEYTYKYDNPVFKAIWEEIEYLIPTGCFRTIDFVEDEINNYEGKEDFLKKWIKNGRNISYTKQILLRLQLLFQLLTKNLIQDF